MSSTPRKETRVYWFWQQLLFVLLASAYCVPARGGVTASLGPASVAYEAERLVISTGKVRREWAWTGRGFKTTSYRSLQDGKEWAAADAAHLCDWSLPSRITNQSQAELVSIGCVESDDEGFASPHLLVTAVIKYRCGLDVKHVVRAYPGASGLWTALEVRAGNGFSPRGVPEDVAFERSYGSRQPVKIARAEFVPIDFSIANRRRYWGFYNDPGHRVNTQDMVKEEVKRGWPLFKEERNDWASGVVVEFDGGGFIAVKESNKTVNVSGHQTGAFYCTPNGLEVTGWGLKPSEISDREYRRTWATWTILYDGGEDEMQLAIKEFDRLRYPVAPERDMHIVLDTWGSDWRNGEEGKIFGRENSAFPVVAKEIESAADLGVDILRIDDGWQVGSTKSLGQWRPNPAAGYAPDWSGVKALASEHGIRIGLWAAVRYISPEELLRNQRLLGVATWKLDFDLLDDWESIHDRLRGARTLVQGVGRRVQLSWCPEYDDPRYGWYSPVREYGPMYFQNVQNNLPRHLVYVPHVTLRHHWMMSKYYNMNALQCHWPNPTRTNPRLSDAHRHSQSYAAMAAFVGSPSCYMLTQFLAPAERDELKETIRLYKQHRPAIYRSFVFPIGDEPSNDSWTGFQMHRPGESSGHLIVFRELHNPDAEHALTLKFLPSRRLRLRDLSHSGETWAVTTDQAGALPLSIPTTPDYRFLEYADLGPTGEAAE